MRFHRRGSAIILAIAVLALLTILTTVYLVASRMERLSSLASDEAVNMDFARDAVVAQIQERLKDDLAAGNHNEQYVPPPWMPGRRYESFDPSNIHQLGNFESEVVLGPDFLLYGATREHDSDLLAHGPPPGNTQDWKPLSDDDGRATGIVASRWYDYPERPYPDRWQAFGFSADRAHNFSGTLDQPLLLSQIDYPGIRSQDNSFLTVARYRPADGRNDMPYDPTPSFAPTLGEASVNAFRDAYWNMLPYASAAGDHYRYAFRVYDTNRMANLNSGYVGNDGIDPDGLSIAALPLNDRAIFNTHDNWPALQHARADALDKFERHSPLEWQQRLLNWRISGDATNIDPRLGLVTRVRAPIQFFDFADELELRAYGGLGTGANARPALAWPGTLTPRGQTDSRRNFFTTWSWERQYGAGFGLAFEILQLPPIPDPPRYPPGLQPIWAYSGGPPLIVHDPLKAYPPVEWKAELVALMNIMAAVGYSGDEAISFAMNDLAQEYGVTDQAIVRKDTNYYYVINGKIFGIFYTVPCKIPWPKIPRPFSAEPPSDVYVPFVAQPFLNELAITIQPPTSRKSTPTALDFAAELLNPYTVPLNLNGWRIRVGNDTWFTFGKDKLPNQIPAAADAEHPGFLTFNLLPSGGFHTSDPDIVTAKNKLLEPIGQPVYLERPYHDQNGDLQYIPVDQFAWPEPPPPLRPGGPLVTLSFQRNNLTTVPTPTQPHVHAVDAWLAACPVKIQRFSQPSLGRPNAVAVGSDRLYGPYLSDRNADTATLFGATYAVPFINRNIGQFEYLLRMCPRIAAGGAAVTLPDMLADPTTLFPKSGRSYFPQEAKVRFDYLADPRAIAFLRYVSTAGGPWPGDRIPGRINVNTARAPVLVAALSSITIDRSLANNIAAAIIAYRDRTRRSLIDDVAFRTNGPDYDFSDPLLFPGRGIRAIPELEIPIGLVIGALTIDRSVEPPQIAPTKGQTLLTLHGTPFVRYRDPFSFRAAADAFLVPPPNSHIYDAFPGIPSDHPGAFWPRLFTMFTVRSDTFVAEGVIDVIRVHPNVPTDPNAKIHHDNAYNWYDFDEGGVAMNPRLSTVDEADMTLKRDSELRNLRVVRLRFIALIDRSLIGDPNHPLESFPPPVVAIKDLPN